MASIELTINGIPFIAAREKADESLLTFLRMDCAHVEVKCGCEQGFCGACTVLIDGKPKKSCLLTVAQAEGKAIVTASGLSATGYSKAAGRLHRSGAVQCGFCMPGIVASLEALSTQTEPSRRQLEKSLEGHVCRCTGYEPIIGGILGTWTEQDPEAASLIGSNPLREDSMPKLLGQAVFADDFQMPGMHHVAVRRAGEPRGILESVEVEAARNAPGVVLVMTERDLPGEKFFGVMKKDQPVLVALGASVLHRGDAVAFVVADTRARALAAAALIELRISPLPAVFDAHEALGDNAPALHAGGNLAFEFISKQGNPGIAEHYAEDEFEIGAVEHAYLEPEAALAWPDEPLRRLVILEGSQNIHADAAEIAVILGVPEDAVETRLAWTGGGFGGKEDLTAQPYAALAAFVSGKPCSCRFSREESILCSTKKHPVQAKIRIGADARGRLKSLHVDAVSAIGPYMSLSSIVLTRFATHVSGPYSWESSDIRVRGAYTNGSIAGAMRGFGVNQACFILETMMDRLAAKLCIDPTELRRRNLVRNGDILGLGERATDSEGLLKCLEAVACRASKTRELPGNTIRAFGLAVAHKNISLGNGSPRDHASVRFTLKPGDGAVCLHTGATDMGQGLFNALRMMAAESLGVPLEKVEVRNDGSIEAPPAGVTSASRQTFMSGNAVLQGAAALKESLMASYGTSDMAKAAALIREPLDFRFRYDAPKTMPAGESDLPGFRSHVGYSWACHGVEVELDNNTGTYRIVRIVAAHDVGKAINRTALRGQIQGGVVMGLGYAATETLEATDGSPSGRMAKLGLLKASRVPPVEIIILEEPLTDAPFGARGIGEISTVPVAAALANALFAASGKVSAKLPLFKCGHGFSYAGKVSLDKGEIPV